MTPRRGKTLPPIVSYFDENSYYFWVAKFWAVRGRKRSLHTRAHTRSHEMREGERGRQRERERGERGRKGRENGGSSGTYWACKRVICGEGAWAREERVYGGRERESMRKREREWESVWERGKRPGDGDGRTYIGEFIFLQNGRTRVEKRVSARQKCVWVRARVRQKGGEDTGSGEKLCICLLRAHTRTHVKSFERQNSSHACVVSHLHVNYLLQCFK